MLEQILSEKEKIKEIKEIEEYWDDIIALFLAAREERLNNLRDDLP